MPDLKQCAVIVPGFFQKGRFNGEILQQALFKNPGSKFIDVVKGGLEQDLCNIR